MNNGFKLDFRRHGFYIAIALCVLAVLLLCFIMLSRVNHRIVLSVSGFSVGGSEITIGGGHSGICFEKLPERWMTVKRDVDGFSWSVARRYVECDSLCYYKVNGVNPNLHRLESDGAVRVKLEDGETVTLCADEISSALKSVKSQYVLLRNVVDLVEQEKGHGHSPRAKDMRGVKSFLWREKKDILVGYRYGDWQIVVLDMRTTLLQGDTETGYADHGRTEELTPGMGEQMKLQFFRVADYSYQTADVDPHSLNIDGVSYQAKAVLVPTSWGAESVLLSGDGESGDINENRSSRDYRETRDNRNNRIRVSFPKSITYVEEVDTLRDLVNATSNMLTVMQKAGSMPAGRNLYVPQFSADISQYLFNLYVSADSIQLRNGTDHSPVESRWSWVPAMQEDCIRNLDNSVVYVETGVLDVRFVLSYLVVPFLIFLLITLGNPLLRGLDRLSRDPVGSGGHAVKGWWLLLLRSRSLRRSVEGHGVNPWLHETKGYVRTLLLLAFAYCVCKIMIAFKLSFTFPYFEKLTGVISVSAGLMLLLVYNLSLVLNRDLLIALRQGESRYGSDRAQWSRVVKSLLVSLLGLVVCLGALYTLDHGFSRHLLSAYLPGELFSLNFLSWQQLSGMNDLHRSIPCTLTLANVVAMVMLLVLLLFPPRGWRVGVRPLFARYCRFCDRLLGLWPIIYHGKAKTNGEKHWLSGSVAFVLKYALPPAAVVFLVSLFPGNFTTAFISLGVVIGLCWAISHVNPSDGRLMVFLQMLITSVVFIFAAIAKADKGYITNYLGILSSIIIIYFLLKWNDGRQGQERERRIIPWLMALVLVFAVLAPFLTSRLTDAESVSYSRLDRRFMMYSQFEKYRDSGYRYAVSDTEFMTVMMHYMYNASGRDPLSNEHHPLHPSVSSGQSPVVLNDLSLQCAFFGAYGWLAYIVYFSLLILLLWVVLHYTLRRSAYTQYLHTQQRWRLVAVMMWVGTTLYLYASYVNQFPFTGRLNPGFGVDSVGEMLESAILLAFMTATPLWKIED